jgi:hypothetical protein
MGEATLAARAVVEGLAREGPVITVIDDLHWADAQLLDLLRGTTADPWSGPVLLLGLSRPDALDGADAVPTLELGALKERELRELGELALGPGAPAQVLDRVATRASGNPLFLEESLSMLVESGALVQRAGAWVVADPRLLERVPATSAPSLRLASTACRPARSACSRTPPSAARPPGTGCSKPCRERPTCGRPSSAWPSGVCSSGRTLQSQGPRSTGSSTC